VAASGAAEYRRAKVRRTARSTFAFAQAGKEETLVEQVMTLSEIFSLSGLCLNILVAVVGLTWGIAKIRDAVKRDVEEHREKIDGELDKLSRNTGEIAIAIRQKITEIELYMRDTFVRRDSFYDAMKQYSSDMRGQFTNLEKRLERMETKLDTKN